MFTPNVGEVLTLSPGPSPRALVPRTHAGNILLAAFSRYACLMFEIPSDLPLSLGSLAWLIGPWQGWGTRIVTQEGEEGSFSLPVLQNIDAQIVDDQLFMRIQTFEGILEEDFDPMWDAETGMDRIQAGDLLVEESLYWKVDTPLATVPAGPDEPRNLRVVSSNTEGFAVLWAGVAMGPRIQLASDGVVRAPGTRPANYFSRMFGLVGGELMWASESLEDPEQGDYEVEMTGRLRRASKS